MIQLQFKQPNSLVLSLLLEMEDGALHLLTPMIKFMEGGLYTVHMVKIQELIMMLW